MPTARSDMTEEHQQVTTHKARRLLCQIACEADQLKPPKTTAQLMTRARLVAMIIAGIKDLYGPPDAQNTRVNLTLIGTMKQLDAASKSMLPPAHRANQTGGRPPFTGVTVNIDPPKDFPSKAPGSSTSEQALYKGQVAGSSPAPGTTIDVSSESEVSSPGVDLRGDANCAGEG
jgi:hypothetical protein